jgi:hypothetical protein
VRSSDTGVIHDSEVFGTVRRIRCCLTLARLTQDLRESVLALAEAGQRVSQIAAALRMSVSCVSKACHGNGRAHTHFPRRAAVEAVDEVIATRLHGFAQGAAVGTIWQAAERRLAPVSNAKFQPAAGAIFPGR